MATKDKIAELLPVITAFAEGKTIQVIACRYTRDWSDIDPETTEFQLIHMLDQSLHWRVKPTVAALEAHARSVGNIVNGVESD